MQAGARWQALSCIQLHMLGKRSCAWSQAATGFRCCVDIDTMASCCCLICSHSTRQPKDPEWDGMTPGQRATWCDTNVSPLYDNIRADLAPWADRGISVSSHGACSGCGLFWLMACFGCGLAAFPAPAEPVPHIGTLGVVCALQCPSHYRSVSADAGI